jgi:alkylation response protein AidB-like acyl-CoA dehydrogenase
MDSSWRERAQVIARDVLARHADDVDRSGRWPAESVAALGQAGLLGLILPAEAGGGGQGARTFATVTRVLAEHCASTAMIYVMHVLAAVMIVQARGLQRRQAVLRDMAAGRHLSTLAISEKGSRSHFWVPISQAVVNGPRHSLSSLKSWVTSAGQADSFVVSTRAAGRSEPTAISLYLVDRDTPGLSTSGSWNGLGLRGNASAPMKLELVSASAADLLCPEGDGFNVMMDAIVPWGQIGFAAVALGIACAATEGTRQHLLASQLEHLGQSLASLMNLRARLARMQILVDSQLAFLDQVIERFEKPGPDTLLALLESKAAAAEAVLEVTDLAMRTCGGAAFSRHLTIERNFRDARAGAVMAPTTDILYDFIGRTLLGMPLF